MKLTLSGRHCPQHLICLVHCFPTPYLIAWRCVQYAPEFNCRGLCCWIADKQLVSDVIMSDVTSIMDVKNAFAMELRGSEVVPVGSRVDEPLHQIERSAHEERCAERVHDTTSEPISVTLASYVDLLTRVWASDARFFDFVSGSVGGTWQGVDEGCLREMLRRSHDGHGNSSRSRPEME